MISEKDVDPVVLTRREKEVLALMMEGHSNKIIADKLFISDHTAKFHVIGIIQKLKAGNRTHAVVKAIRQGLITV
jgi:two-component system, NarL family, nitrate/nitrite response regulator NarL